MTSPIVERLQQVATHDWRVSFLGHTADTAKEAAATIERLSAELARARAAAIEECAKAAEGVLDPAEHAAFEFGVLTAMAAIRAIIEKEPQG